MKVEIKTKDGSDFKPFKVVFHIDSVEDAIEFHDKVAINICQGPHEFIGNVYTRRCSEFAEDKIYELEKRR